MIKNITEIKSTQLGLDFVNDLNPVSYKWIDGKRQKGDENINRKGRISGSKGVTTEIRKKYLELIENNMEQLQETIGLETQPGGFFLSTVLLNNLRLLFYELHRRLM